MMAIHSVGDDVYLISEKYGDAVRLELTDIYKYSDESMSREKFYMLYPDEPLTYSDWEELNGRLYDEDGENALFWDSKEIKSKSGLAKLAVKLNMTTTELAQNIGTELKITYSDLEKRDVEVIINQEQIKIEMVTEMLDSLNSKEVEQEDYDWGF
jgi:hypothetical protein